MARISSTRDAEKLRQELAQLNQELEANNNLLQEAQALTHLGSWQWNVATGAIDWSDELYRIYGLKPQEREIGYEEFLNLIHPQDRQRISESITTAFQSKQDFEFEHRIILPTKKIRILYGKGKVVTNKAGDVLRMVGTSQDITERHKADAALKLSDERFKAVSAGTNDIVYDIDLQEDTIWFNEVLNTEYGYPRSRAAKKPLWRLSHIHTEDRKRIEDAIQKLLKGSATKWVESYRFKKSDGSYIDIRDRAFVIRDSDKKPIRIIGSMLDITQQKELERAKDNFISLVSHQLRTPLTAMRLLVDMLSGGYGGDLSAQQKDYLDKIGSSTVRMIQLVGDILNVSQIERGRLKVVPVPTDVCALIQWHIDELRPMAEKQHITIKLDYDSEIDNVLVDPILFSQIIHNLLTNAIRYTQKSDSVITISFEKDKDGYNLSVQDQGIGIPKSVQRRIFNSFFRADNAVRVHGDGTGLGLYLVKLIIDTAGGKVHLKSREGVGSTFSIWLPIQGMHAVDGDKTLMATGRSTHGRA